MCVSELLLETLENLYDNDFKKFKWYLSMDILEGCKPIPKSRLDKATRTDIVTMMIDDYRNESAVRVTVAILRKMRNNNAAHQLEEKYAAPPAAPVAPPAAQALPPAVPATMSAQHGSVIIAPTVSSSTAGTWHITVNK